MNVKWDSDECEEKFNNLDRDKKLLLQLKVEGTKLMSLVSEVDRLIDEIDESSNEDVKYIMCNEVFFECIRDLIMHGPHKK